MTQLREVAYLELDTFSLAGTSNINASFTNWIFRNVDLRSVMGDMWNKYDKFVIKLQQLNTNGAVSIVASSNSAIAINMAGLDWINLYYEAGGSIQKWAPITQVISAATGNWNQEYLWPNNSVGINFRKGQPIVDLEFQIYTIANNNLDLVTTFTYANNQMALTIEPAEDNENEMGLMVLNTNTGINTPGKVVTNSVYTYNNFNIKDVCREFWDKYDDFELIYANYTSTSAGNVSVVDAQQIVAMRGFDFINNYVGTGSGSYLMDLAVLACNRFGATGTTHIYDVMMPTRVQFKKSNATMQLELQFRTYDNSATSTLSIANRRWQGIFYIKPIRKELGCCEKGTLVLSGAGMTTTPENFGVTNASVTNTTWRNINLRNVCRGFWDKYTKFNIFLNQSQNSMTTADATEQALALYMSGLNFETPWNVNPNIGSQVWTIGGVMFGHTITTQSIFSVSNGNTKGIMFNKTSDVVDINMFVQTIDGSALAATGSLNGTFIFTIVGVE